MDSWCLWPTACTSSDLATDFTDGEPVKKLDMTCSPILIQLLDQSDLGEGEQVAAYLRG